MEIMENFVLQGLCWTWKSYHGVHKVRGIFLFSALFIFSFTRNKVTGCNLLLFSVAKVRKYSISMMLKRMLSYERETFVFPQYLTIFFQVPFVDKSR